MRAAIITWRKERSFKNIVFEKDDLMFYMPKSDAQLRLHIAVEKPRVLSSCVKAKLRRFIRDCVKTEGGTLHHELLDQCFLIMNKPKTQPRCPSCGRPLVKRTGIPLLLCKSPLHDNME